ncbi:hypothetical protein D3C80_1978820 [compost metagenome]
MDATRIEKQRIALLDRHFVTVAGGHAFTVQHVEKLMRIGMAVWRSCATDIENFNDEDVVGWR